MARPEVVLCPLTPGGVRVPKAAGGRDVPAPLMNPPGSPERALLVKLVVDAVEAVLRADEGTDAARRARDARTWMEAVEPDWPFSFENVCRVLLLDPAAVRGALLPSVETSGEPRAALRPAAPGKPAR